MVQTCRTRDSAYKKILLSQLCVEGAARPAATKEPFWCLTQQKQTKTTSAFSLYLTEDVTTMEQTSDKSKEPKVRIGS